VIEEKYVAMLDYIMSTNELRAPTFGTNNPFKFDNRPVAAKTGTTNEFRDGWAMGYTPSIAVGVWTGNNNNASMKEGADGIVVAAPIWRSFMDKILVNYPVEQFPKYEEEDAGKDILNGIMDKQKNVKVCKIPDKKNEYCLASDACPSDYVEKKDFADIHTILYYVSKDDPRGNAPKNPKDDSLFKNWEEGVQAWLKKNDKKNKNGSVPTDECEDSDFSSLRPEISLAVSGNATTGFSLSAKVDSPFDVDRVIFSANGNEIKSMSDGPYTATYNVEAGTAGSINFEAEIKDEKGNKDSDSETVEL
jgi:membrane peptidoglycan carboxypeptidase